MGVNWEFIAVVIAILVSLGGIVKAAFGLHGFIKETRGRIIANQESLQAQIEKGEKSHDKIVDDLSDVKDTVHKIDNRLVSVEKDIQNIKDMANGP